METDGFGKINCAKEELTAEMTAAYLCAVTGIGQPTIENSAAYIENWLNVLKNDKTLIIKLLHKLKRLLIIYLMRWWFVSRING